MKYNQTGNILIWALIIVMFIIGTVLFMSAFMISSLQQGRRINESIKAWHLADAGIEYTLYEIRKLEQYDVGETDLGDGKVISSIVGESDLVVNLGEDEAYQLDLYDFQPGEEVGSLYLQGSTDNAWLEIQVVSWQLGSQLPGDGFYQDLSGPTDINGGFYFNLPVVSGYYHKVKLKALYGDIDNLSITAYPAYGGTDPINIPGIIKVNVVGGYNRASQEISVSMPKRAPLYGLFDYVIFSEKLITK